MPKSKSVLMRALVASITLAGTAALAAELRPLEGPVILTKGGANPEYLWNSTTFVAHMTTDKLFGDDALHALEAAALAALADKAKTSKAASVRIKVIYAMTGEVSPVYRSATFVGMENVLSITAPRGELEKHASDWPQQVASGHAPGGVSIAVTGKLPIATP
jgi:hypothetical protein